MLQIVSNKLAIHLHQTYMQVERQSFKQNIKDAQIQVTNTHFRDSFWTRLRGHLRIAKTNRF